MTAKKTDKAAELLAAFMLFMVPLIYSPQSYNPVYIKWGAVGVPVFLTGVLFMLKKGFAVKKEAFYPFVFAAWALLAAFFSPYPYASVPAFAKMFPAVFLFFFTASFNAGNFIKIRHIVAASAFLPALAGITQAAGAPFTAPFMQFGDRVPSALGNPNFFGAYLVAVLPVVFLLFIKAQGKARALYAVFIGIIAACIFLTGSKGAMAGVFFEALLGILVFGYKKRKKRKIIIAGGITVVLACVLIYAAAVGLITQGKSGEKNDSLFFRAKVWKGTVEMTADRPVTGRGPGAFSAAFPAYRPDEIMLWSSEHSYEVSYPENILLQTAAEGGVFAGLIFIALIYIILKNREKNRLDFTAGFLGILTVNLFGVDLNYAASAALFAFYGGLIINSGEKRAVKIRGKTAKIFTGAAVVILGASLVIQFKNFVSDVYLKEAVYCSRLKDFSAADKFYSRAVSINRFNIPALYFSGRAFMDREEKRNPGAALARFNRVEELAPNYVLLHHYKGEVYEAMGKTEKAVKEYEKMLKTDPYHRESLINLAYIYYDKKQKFDKAEKCLEKALEKYKDDASLYNNLGNIYFMSKRLTKSIKAYKKAIDLKENKDYYYNLGCVYFTLNDPENAEKYLLKARGLAPEDRRVKKMMEMIRHYRRITNSR